MGPPSATKQRPISRHRSAEPFPPTLPAKAIDLNSSTKSIDRETGNKITRRAFLCDVVVERQGEETANLLAHLGEPLRPLSTLPPPPTFTNERPQTPSCLPKPRDEDDEPDDIGPTWTAAKRDEMKKRLANLIEELVRTERSYLSRVHALKTAYADPLRLYSKDPNQQLIPPYEAKAMFANIEVIVPASTTFLSDLENIMESGRAEELVGDVCLKHLQTLRTFDPYRTYLSKQDESQKLFQDCLKRFSSFSSFIESTKYQTTGIGNIGLRELLMEPVQRIPRYTLLWQTMVKCMSPLSDQRAKLLDAIEIASRIAKCEPDAQTVRATVMYNLERNIDDFPAKIFSNNRDYIDSIDVEDLPAEYPTSPHSRPMPTSSRATASSASTSLQALGSLPTASQLPQSPQAGSAVANLHCTLFLFDDKLMIVKRQSSSISGRKVTGTDDVQKLVRTGGGVAIKEKNNGKRDKLSFRGEVDVLDVMASDIGNGDFHLYFERPPMEYSGRWSGRPFRSFSTVHPPYSVALDPVATKRDKLRFVQNLWAAQALVRAKLLPSSEQKIIPRVLQSEQEVDFEGESERARCFWNVWDRQGWLTQMKSKVVIHVDEDGLASELPLDGKKPVLCIYLQPMAGGLCRYSHYIVGEEEEGRGVIEMDRVKEKIATTIHQHEIFKFRIGTTSAPTTPSAGTHRLRPSMLNLDTISRNLFGNGSISGRSGSNSDMFSTTSSKRGSRAGMSRSSTLDASIYSASVDAHEENVKEKEKEPKKRFSKMSISLDPGLIAGAPYSSGEGETKQNETELNQLLDMGRKNSQTTSVMLSSPKSGAGHRLGAKSVADLRKEHEGLVLAERPISSAATTNSTPPLPSKSSALSPVRRKTPRYDKIFNPPADSTPQAQQSSAMVSETTPMTAPLNIRKTPSRVQTIRSEASSIITSNGKPGSSMLTSQPSLSRPIGPRGPSIKSSKPTASSMTNVESAGRTPGADYSLGSAHTRLRIVSGHGRRVSLNRETMPLKGEDENNPSSASSPTANTAPKRQHSAECLSPRKRSPSINRSPLGEPTVSSVTVRQARRTSGRGTTTTRKTSGPLMKARTVSASHNSINSVASVDTTNTVGTVDSCGTGESLNGIARGGEDVEMKEFEDLLSALDASLKKIHDARGSTKRLRSEMSSLRKQITRDAIKSKDSLGVRMERNGSLPRSPVKRNINRFIEQDAYDSPSLSRHSSHSKKEIDTIVMDECARGILQIAQRVDHHLKQAEVDTGQASDMGKGLLKENEEKDREIIALKSQLQRSKEHQELLARQLGDAQIELDVVYEAFNTELEGMFNDAQLPNTEAFQALRNDLQMTKADRNVVKLENQRLRRELEEANLKTEQWTRILKTQEYNM
ncbi:uncharacterized protein L203_106336 [Cryptococcus depauperatus CBS 7841]|uniref:DH domain-containing protein n=1 Tax=Cryptococcus depauperatus CBS 7841 TaxID=1295531 RepID=A0AAJ8JZC6_9TREE